MLHNGDGRRLEIGEDFKLIFEEVFKRGNGENKSENKSRLVQSLRSDLSRSSTLETLDDFPSREVQQRQYSDPAISETTSSTASNERNTPQTTSSTASNERKTPRGSVLKSLVERFRNSSPKQRSNRRRPQLWWLPPTPRKKVSPNSSVRQSPATRSFGVEKNNILVEDCRSNRSLLSTPLNHFPQHDKSKRNRVLLYSPSSNFSEYEKSDKTNLFSTVSPLPDLTLDFEGDSPNPPLISPTEGEVDVEALLADWRSSQKLGNPPQYEFLDSAVDGEDLSQFMACSLPKQVSDSSTEEVEQKNNLKKRSLNKYISKKNSYEPKSNLLVTEKRGKVVGCKKMAAAERPGNGTLREERLSAERVVRVQKLKIGIKKSPKKPFRRPIRMLRNSKGVGDDIPFHNCNAVDENDNKSSSSSSSSSSSQPELTQSDVLPLINDNSGNLKELPRSLRSRLAVELKKSGAQSPKDIDKVLRRVLNQASEMEVREVIHLREELLKKKKNREEKEKNVVVRKSMWTNFDEVKEISDMLSSIRQIRKEALEILTR